MKSKILLRAPILTRSGYGEHGRFVLRALMQMEEKYDIYVFPVSWGKCGWIYEDSEERRTIDQLVQKTAIYQQQSQGNPQYDISIQVTIPNEWQPLAPVNIGVTAGIESTKVTHQWIEKFNQMHEVVTISKHSKLSFLNTIYDAVNKHTGERSQLRCNKDVHIVHYPVKQFDHVDLNLNLSTDFNFLTVAQWGPRKNLINTIKWFVEEFIDNPKVGLVVKTFQTGNSVSDRYNIIKLVSNVLDKYDKRKCKIYLLHGDMSDCEIHSLYKNDKIKALISLAHGEGFGLPIFEAAYSGLPVVAVDWSGHLDFLYAPKKDKKTGKEKLKPYFARVEYDLAPIAKEHVWAGVLEADSMWSYAQPGSYKMRLRETYKEYGRLKKQASHLQKWLLENFKEKDQYEKFNNVLKDYVADDDDWNVDGWYDALNSGE